MRWAILIGTLILVSVAGGIFLIDCIRRLRFVAVLTRGHKTAGWAVGTVVFLVPFCLIWVLWGYLNAIIVLLHLILAWGVAELVRRLLQKRRKNRSVVAGRLRLRCC